MKIKAIRLKEVGRFSAPIALEGLSGGLDVLSGPNEFGKSTILKAVKAALFDTASLQASQARSASSLFRRRAADRGRLRHRRHGVAHPQAVSVLAVGRAARSAIGQRHARRRCGDASCRTARRRQSFRPAVRRPRQPAGGHDAAGDRRQGAARRGRERSREHCRRQRGALRRRPRENRARRAGNEPQSAAAVRQLQGGTGRARSLATRPAGSRAASRGGTGASRQTGSIARASGPASRHRCHADARERSR